MDLRDFVALTLLACDGEVQGTTKLQKLVYFVGALTEQMDELGYRAHFYGPHSDEVAHAVGQLRAIGAVDENATNWGSDNCGFETKRYDYRLNPAGRKYAENLCKRNAELWDKIHRAIESYKRSGELDYMGLSIAAKTYFLLGQRKQKSSLRELASLVPRFGWSVGPAQMTGAGQFLEKLGLVQLTPH